MGKKEDKKKKLAIKTSRYFTKTCHNCNNEYPNWFTQCPQCGTAWDDIDTKASVDEKTIKIVVRITEEDFNEYIDHLQLIFSGDQGKSWYQMEMKAETDYFIAEMADVPNGTVIIYYIEVYLENGVKHIENNDGNYFYYRVGVPSEETKEELSHSEAQMIQNNIKVSDQEPQTQIDPDLIVCPHCNSKIKKMWSTCPFCGGNV